MLAVGGAGSRIVPDPPRRVRADGGGCPGQSKRWALSAVSVPGGAGTTQNRQARGVTHHLPGARRGFPARAGCFQPGYVGREVVGVDVQVHACLPGAEPLDEQRGVPAGQRAAVVLGVLADPGQRLAGGCLPEGQLLVVDGRRHVDDHGAQPAEVRHGA